MLDIKYIKENPEEVIARLAKKGKDAKEDIAQILTLDTQRRALIGEVEAIKAEQNKATKQIPQLKKAGQDTAPIFAELKAMGDRAKAIDEQLKEVETQLTGVMLGLPNLPDTDLKDGGKENNEPLRYWGEPRKFDFEPQNHVDLCTSLGLIDYDRGTKLAGSGFWIYRGMGARLEWALLNYFIDTHIADGYELILPPHMLEYECGLTAGQFPKFADEVYKIENPTDNRMHYMLPTAEAALASLYRNELMTEADFPKKLVSYTPQGRLCRRGAGLRDLHHHHAACQGARHDRPRAEPPTLRDAHPVLAKRSVHALCRLRPNGSRQEPHPQACPEARYGPHGDVPGVDGARTRVHP